MCYSAVAEIELNKPKIWKHEHVNKKVSTTECNKISNGNVQLSRDPQSAEVRFYIIITEQ